LKVPKVSVLIPTYNYARYLPEAIESVLAQTLTDFELLIFDDQSTDDTAEVVKPFLSDQRVRFVVNERNIGMVNNWNLCLREASGEYVKFLFGDDKFCDARCMEELVKMMESHPTATLAASARVILDEESRPVTLWRTLPSGLHQGSRLIVSLMMRGAENLIGEPSSVLFRRKDAVRGFNPQLRQIVDLEMWFHLLEKGDLIYTGRPLCGFRRHPVQQTNVNDASGVAKREHVVAFANYACQATLPKRAIYAMLFRLRRSKPTDWAATIEQRLELERRLIEHAGRGWAIRYLLYFVVNRIITPFKNLRRSVSKRYFRWYVRRLSILGQPPMSR
jgi:glycosyltransferase involved in cell wall biosynthesis